MTNLRATGPSARIRAETHRRGQALGDDPKGGACTQAIIVAFKNARAEAAHGLGATRLAARPTVSLATLRWPGPHLPRPCADPGYA